MTQMATERTDGRKRARRAVLNEKNILQKLALKTRQVSGTFTRDKVDGSLDLMFVPEDGRTTQFRLTPDQARELRVWLDDTARFEQ